MAWSAKSYLLAEVVPRFAPGRSYRGRSYRVVPGTGTRARRNSMAEKKNTLCPRSLQHDQGGFALDVSPRGPGPRELLPVTGRGRWAGPPVPGPTPGTRPRPSLAAGFESRPWKQRHGFGRRCRWLGARSRRALPSPPRITTSLSPHLD